MLKQALTITTVLVTATGLSARISAAQDATALEAITVLGTGLPTSVFESPSSVTVIDDGQLRRIAPEKIGSYLESVPGVIIGEQGIQRIQIRGEAERRVLIKVDGQALTDHTTYGQPVLVDPLNIERIEVIRGASSVVSGSRAIGGVVNIVTKRGAPDTAAEVTFGAGYFGGSDGYRASGSVGGTIGAFDYRITAGTADFGDRETPDRTLVPSESASDSLAVHLGYQIDPNQYVMFKAQRYDQSADVFTDDPDFTITLPNRDLTKYSAFYEGTDLAPWMPKLNADVYYQTVDRVFENDVNTGVPPFVPNAPTNIQGLSDDEGRTWGLNVTAELSIFDIGRSFVGFEYEDDRLDTARSSIVTANPPPGPPGPPVVSVDSREEDASIKTTSLYALQEFDLSDTVTGFLGGRYYAVDAELIRNTRSAPRSNDDDRFLGSAGLVWTPNPETALRLNISQGYSYPSLGQLFLETSAGGQTVIGNPDLEPETATTLELGARYDGAGATIDATFFYTDSSDYIELTAAGGGTLSYTNIAAAEAFGLEVLAETRIGASNWSPYASLTYVRREFDFGNGFKTKDSGTPELFGRVGVKYDFDWFGMTGVLDAHVRGETSATLRDETGAVVRSGDGFGLLEVDAFVNISENASLTVALNNLLNTTYDPIDQIEGQKRSVDVFLTWTF
ncbi:TonB-dependent receptor [Dinoroseobacter sp. PD6]|uniref:TonB-dependent receptor n=1 Tax=Dinoroseobacter sp. PD6 TaxID=3028384 RepID=UPI00237BF23E|nr:TonB-dependent receptor [Dinoroseobacter sp. PD6]MDD9717523.1 TonB-dependent receptor [Dinoroseobacter sp. PD6]